MINKDDQLVTATFLAILMVGFLIYLGFWYYNSSGIVEFVDMPSRKAEYFVDVNVADWPELSNLPGIGEHLAKQIVGYRIEKGPFTNVNELMDVPGIGPVKLDKMRPFLKPIH